MSSRTVCGIGINDSVHTVSQKVAGKTILDQEYRAWTGMLNRCYSAEMLKRQPRYEGCEVCEEWQKFSVFAKWYLDRFQPGYAVDKDIIKPGNKLYSPETSALVPSYINLAVVLPSRVSNMRTLPLGVTQISNEDLVTFQVMGTEKHFTYLSPQDAHAVWQERKICHILKVIDRYLGEPQPDPRIVKALLCWAVQMGKDRDQGLETTRYYFDEALYMESEPTLREMIAARDNAYPITTRNATARKTKQCLMCGCMFQGTVKARFCGTTCRVHHHRGWPIKFPDADERIKIHRCVVCGVEFYAIRQKFVCGNTCNMRRFRARIKLEKPPIENTEA